MGEPGGGAVDGGSCSTLSDPRAPRVARTEALEWLTGVFLVARGRIAPGTRTLRGLRWRVRPHRVLEGGGAIRCPEVAGMEPLEI